MRIENLDPVLDLLDPEARNALSRFLLLLVAGGETAAAKLSPTERVLLVLLRYLVSVAIHPLSQSPEAIRQRRCRAKAQTTPPDDEPDPPEPPPPSSPRPPDPPKPRLVTSGHPDLSDKQTTPDPDLTRTRETCPVQVALESHPELAPVAPMLAGAIAREAPDVDHGEVARRIAAQVRRCRPANLAGYVRAAFRAQQAEVRIGREFAPPTPPTRAKHIPLGPLRETPPCRPVEIRVRAGDVSGLLRGFGEVLRAAQCG